MAKPVIIPIFPTLIHGVEIENFKDEQQNLIDFVYGEQKKDPKGIELSNHGCGGWHSNNEYHFSENYLSDFIMKSLKDYFSNSDIFVSRFEFSLIGLWMNINPPGAFNKAHMHPGSHYSGVFWVKLPKDSGSITFQNDSSFKCFNELLIYNSKFKEDTIIYQNYSLFPGEGAMVLFPSSLYHCVEENKSDEDRISISFNVELGGILPS